MQKYLIQLETTPEAVAALVHNPQNRAEIVRPMIEAAGGKLEQYYYDIEGTSVFSIIEMPDSESLAAFFSAAFASGSARSYKATAILTSEEMVNVFKRAGSIDYQPPSA